ncbi:MAG: hypothetical protein J5546_03485, partial [Lachnospiraceae bacterium]|nr:hypothetical protein [Lachnospiraceae bacterium]
MKRYHKRNYLWFFRKHFIISLILWAVVLYAFLQICFLVIFEKEKQKTAVNFYEGMEKIQYLVKDHSLAEVEAEATQALEAMSLAGSISEHTYMDGGVGSVLGVRLSDFEAHFMVLSGHGYDGDGNTFIAGLGRGYGFIQDTEDGRLVFETGHENERYDLHLINKRREEDLRYNKSVVYKYEYENLLFCKRAILDPYLETLEQIKEKALEEYRKTNPDTPKKFLRWQLEEIYVKGDRFYPAKAVLYYFDTATNYVILPDNADVELLETYVSEPSDLMGYSLRKLDLKEESAILPYLNSGPYAATNPMWEPDDAFRQMALSEINTARIKGRASDVGGGFQDGNPLTYFLNGEMKFVRTAYFQDAQGHRYKISVYQNMSKLFRGNLYFVMCWTIYLAIVFFLIAVIVSYLEYQKKRHIFMTREYRNMLMDSMAHDLKSPLMAIGGYAENLQMHMNDEKRDHYA